MSEKMIVISKYNCEQFNKQCNKCLDDGYFLVSSGATPLNKEEAKNGFDAHFWAIFVKNKDSLVFSQ